MTINITIGNQHGLREERVTNVRNWYQFGNMLTIAVGKSIIQVKEVIDVTQADEGNDRTGLARRAR